MDWIEDFRRYVNPGLLARAELMGEPLRLRLEGGALRDDEGRPVLDALSAWGTQLFGHGDAGVAAAIRSALEGGLGLYPSGISPGYGALARELCARSACYERVWLASGGSEAVEGAIKLARAASGRRRVLSMRGAYHGCTYGSVTMMEPGPFRDGFGPFVEGFEALPFGDIGALEGALAAGDVAALVLEPIQVEAGFRAAPPDFLAALAAAQERGLIVIADEIQTGLGRVDGFLRSASWPRRPDVVCLAKGLGGGWLPLSAVLTSSALFDAAYGGPHQAERHNSTMSGNSLACAAGLATLERLTAEFYARVSEAGERLSSGLEEALAGMPLFGGVVGEGLLLGLVLKQPEHPYFCFEYLGSPELDPRPAVGFLACHRLYRSGVLTQVCGHRWDVLRLQPALTIGDEAIDRLIAACAEQVGALCRLL